MLINLKFISYEKNKKKIFKNNAFKKKEGKKIVK